MMSELSDEEDRRRGGDEGVDGDQLTFLRPASCPISKASRAISYLSDLIRPSVPTQTQEDETYRPPSSTAST